MLLTNLIRTSVAALGALAVASVTQANAADVYTGGGGYKDVPVVAPCCSFSGFYIGGNMGIAWSQLNLNALDFQDRFWGGDGMVWNTNHLAGRTVNSTNGFGGGQFGYNWQNQCCYLFGIEVDLGALALNNRNHAFLPVNDNKVVGVSFDNNGNNDAFFAGDVTGRVGYTFGNSLVYLKGGFAFVDANNTGLSETIFWRTGRWGTPTGNPFDTFNGNNNSNWLTGWTLGAGYEWKPCCQSNWSIKVEYLYYDFSNNNNNCCNDWYEQNYGVNRFHNNNDLTVNTIKIGFNYFLNPSVAVPLK
jgi:outer membrane immunogenic protein